MELDPESLSVLVDPAEGVRGVPVHMPVAVRSAPVAEQDGHLVGALGTQSPEIPSRNTRTQVGPGVLLLRVNEVRELDGVPNEEDGSVVASHVPVALLSVKLDCEAYIAKQVPLGSLSVSAAPFSPATVEKRRKTGVFFPMESKSLALVNLETSWVTSKYPWAAAPLAWTTRSGMRSRSKWASLSSRWKSEITRGPHSPAVTLFWLSSTGCPVEVVITCAIFY